MKVQFEPDLIGDGRNYHAIDTDELICMTNEVEVITFRRSSGDRRI